MQSPSSPLIDDLDFAAVMPNPPHSELHTRVIEAPIDRVWQSLLELPADEIRLLKPLFALRGLPATVLGRRAPQPIGADPVLDLFAKEGFVMLRKDAEPSDGHAIMIFGAAGKFWSPAHNGPVQFESAADFVEFDQPGNAITFARFEAWQVGGRTRLETETVVDVTDPASRRKFASYWAVIRAPSGLLRRSWLAAVDRRARAER